MFQPLPSTFLTFLFALPALSYASPQPALVSSDYEISLVPRHTLFLRQLSDLQTFDQALGGERASAITNSGDTERPFSVDGQTFDSFSSAAQRSCDNQFQACQRAANGNNNNNNGNQANTNNNGGNGNQRNGNNNGNGNQNGNNNNNNNKNNNNNGNGNGNGNGNNKNKSKDRRQEGGNETSFDMEKRQDLTVNQCDQQKNQCNSFQQTAQVKDFQTAVASTNIGPDPLFPDFDLICEG